MIPVKICGITTLKYALMAENLGASAIGIIFYENSKRYVEPQKVAQWIHKVPSQIKRVGVFVNQKIELVQSISNQLKLDFIQLHGDESPEYCNEICQPIIKVIHIDKCVDSSIFKKYDVYAFLLDTYAKGKYGGTGKAFNWHLVSDMKSKVPIILSGGLDAENIIASVNIVKPQAVDLSSSLESSPGKKDGNKMKQFFDVLKNTISCNNLFNEL